ncbi:MAG: glycosyltransferase family 2 protein [Actinobacteria bacterium]|nr:glycosyltransferase family 2 protein [Actinomycetota bacterium]
MRKQMLAIVPAYNESAAIAAVVGSIQREAPEFDVLVVDDGSTDSTYAQARRAGVAVLRLPFNLGIGGAVQTGYAYAFENGYEYAAQVDGDGQHDPAQLRTLLDRIQSDPPVEMVYGTRFGGKEGFKSSFARRAGIRLFAAILSAVTRQRVTDPTSGFRLCNRRAIELFARNYPLDYPEVEAILLMHRHELRSAEVPVSMRVRAGGRSSITLLHSGYYMIKVLLAVFVGLFRARHHIEPGDDAPTSGIHGI